MDDELHKPAQVAEYLGTSEGALAQLRYRGLGPRFIKLGSKAVRYRDSDLKRWLDEQTRQQTGAA
ncbi:helix-turn-helix transcriptional regulator [Paenarthrobacter ureafaciens]|uniref:helix-turn-helix transcriptional regulator n=1 Tax=Paenarthrobacter ureafaciens TaxID=37931 RepID=UPI0034639266